MEINLSRHDLEALTWAISRAAEWRGAMTHFPEPNDRLRRFDTHLNSARAAMRKLHDAKNRDERPR